MPVLLKRITAITRELPPRIMAAAVAIANVTGADDRPEGWGNPVAECFRIRFHR